MSVIGLSNAISRIAALNLAELRNIMALYLMVYLYPACFGGAGKLEQARIPTPKIAIKM